MELSPYVTPFSRMMERARKRPPLFVDDFGRAHYNSQQIYLDSAGIAYSHVQEFEPCIELIENTNSYILRVELPGVDKDTIDLRIDKERHIILRGSKIRPESDEVALSQPINEIIYGPFKRIFTLPLDVSIDPKIFGEAVFENGILSVFLPKVESMGIKIK